MDKKTGADKRLKKIYAVTQHGGRRAPAFIFDAAAMLAVLFFVLCLVFRPHTESRAASRAAALICTLLAGLFLAFADAALRRKHIEKLRRIAASEAADKKLLLSPDALFSGLSETSGTVILKKIDALTADDIAFAAGKGTPLTIVTLAEPTEKAKELLGLFGGEIVIKDAREAAGVSAEDLFPVSEAETDEQILRKYADVLRVPSFKADLSKMVKARRTKYFAVGAALMAMSFFMRYPLYYRIMGSAMLSVGSWIFLSERTTPQKKKEPV